TTHGLIRGEITELSLAADPSNGNPYDNVNDGTVSVTLVDVPEGAPRLIASILASEAPDIDMFVGMGSTPGPDTEVCVSATGTALESCVIDYPEAGIWWILVQNWEASDAPPDDVTLAHGVVIGDEGN